MIFHYHKKNHSVILICNNKPVKAIIWYAILKHNQNFIFEALSNKLIKIVDIQSAERQVTQWISQKQQFNQVELAVKAYIFYHCLCI